MFLTTQYRWIKVLIFIPFPCSVLRAWSLGCRNLDFFHFSRVLIVIVEKDKLKNVFAHKNFILRRRTYALIFSYQPKFSLATVYNTVFVMFAETSYLRTCRIRPLVWWPSRMSPTFWYTRSAVSLCSRCLATTIQEPSGARRSRTLIWEITGDSGYRRTLYRHLIKVSENCFFQMSSTYNTRCCVYTLCVCFFLHFKLRLKIIPIHSDRLCF